MPYDVSTHFSSVTMAPENKTASFTVNKGYSGKVTTLNAAAGMSVTLPAATGSGSSLKFFIGTTVTSNSIAIYVSRSSDVMSGVALVAADGGNTLVAFETGATDNTITLNGTTTGGILGDFIELVDVATNQWYVRVTSSATGTEATPFSVGV